jgi:hypothetical protein
MKKSLVWIVLLGLAFSFNACKDDPDPVPAIVGTWNLSKYVYTDLPTGFTKYEGYEDVQVWGIEVGYTFVFNQDGTYTRAYNVGGGYPSISDKGKWTLDGTSLKLSPDDPDDLDLIEYYGTVGTQFAIVGDITDIRLTVNNSEQVTVPLLPDDFDTTNNTPTIDDLKPVSFTLQYKFNKL